MSNNGRQWGRRRSSTPIDGDDGFTQEYIDSSIAIGMERNQEKDARISPILHWDPDSNLVLDQDITPSLLSRSTANLDRQEADYSITSLQTRYDSSTPQAPAPARAPCMIPITTLRPQACNALRSISDNYTGDSVSEIEEVMLCENTTVPDDASVAAFSSLDETNLSLSRLDASLIPQSSLSSSQATIHDQADKRKVALVEVKGLVKPIPFEDGESLLRNIRLSFHMSEDTNIHVSCEIQCSRHTFLGRDLDTANFMCKKLDKISLINIVGSSRIPREEELFMKKMKRKRATASEMSGSMPDVLRDNLKKSRDIFAKFGEGNSWRVTDIETICPCCEKAQPHYGNGSLKNLVDHLRRKMRKQDFAPGQTESLRSLLDIIQSYKSK